MPADLLPPDDALFAQHAELRTRLQEAEETLRAIRSGAADALVVDTAGGPQVFMLQGLEDGSNRCRGEILAEVSDAIVVIDDNQCVTYLNAAAERQYGVSASEALGHKLSAIYRYRWARPQDEAAAMTALRDTGCWRGENIHIKRSGEEIEVESAVSRLNAGDDSRPSTLAVIRDVTERKREERKHMMLADQLRESQKMEALGTLAGGVAHDFNNILGTILINIQLARRDAAANWKALVSLEEIEKAARRAGDLVQQILAFGRREMRSRQVISLPSAVEESVRLLRAALTGKVGVEYHYATDTPWVLVDVTQVQQVVLNLGNNAAYAMEGRAGSIDIRVDGVTLDAAAARLHPNLRPGLYARIVVSDTGQGMDMGTQKRIFEPFFTTKPHGEGTGLGLAVVHGILQHHEAGIVVHSEPGRGSRFEVYFPGVNDLADALGTDAASGEANQRRGHILYIDDDQPQLFASKRMLESWGYRVSAYYQQREALEAVLVDKSHFDLLVTDFKMPGTSGLEVARAIHNVLPKLPMIMVSGYITDELRGQAAAAGVQELIAKPQDLEELRDAVQRLITPYPA